MSEREPGSIGLARTAEDVEQRRQFVDSWGVGLSHVQRRCEACGVEWNNPRQCQACGSHVFTEKAIDVPPLEVGPDGPWAKRIGRWLVPEAPKPAPHPEDLAALEYLKASARVLLVALELADAPARRLANLDPERYGFLQSKVAVVATPGGDASPTDLDKPLTPKLVALADLIEKVL